MFILGALGWGATLFISSISMHELLGVVARDLLVLAFAGGAMQMSKGNGVISLAIFGLAAVFLNVTYLDILKNSLVSNDNKYADIELLLELSGEPGNELHLILDNYSATLMRAFAPRDEDITELDQYYLVNLPGKAREGEILALIDRLEDYEETLWVEANDLIQIPEITEDLGGKESYKDAKISVNDPEVGKQWSAKKLSIQELHQILAMPTVQPKAKALIAILDTGVDGNHEDLAAVYRSTNKQYDIDKVGHGTHVAGIAGAVTNNGIGIASFDPTNSFVEITSIKVLQDNGFGSQAKIIDGMIEAADLGAQVISMSLGARSSGSREKAYEQAVKYCNDKGAIVIVAAGNSSRSAKHFAPANARGVITVAAIDANLNRASFSNTVADITYGIAAPGDDIYSTFPGDQYRSLRGTSMACPYVAGVVAIMKSIDPSLETEQIHNILKNSGTPAKQDLQTGQIINPVAAIRALLD